MRTCWSVMRSRTRPVPSWVGCPLLVTPQGRPGAPWRGVPRQVEVRPVVNPFEFLPTKGKLVLDVVGVLGVVRQLVFRVLVEPQLVGPHAQSGQPLHPLVAPELEPLEVRARLHEVLHLHLLELAGPKDEVAGSDLVPECFADLRDPEGDLLA